MVTQQSGYFLAPAAIHWRVACKLKESRNRQPFVSFEVLFL